MHAFGLNSNLYFGLCTGSFEEKNPRIKLGTESAPFGAEEESVLQWRKPRIVRNRQVASRWARWVIQFVP